MLRRSIAAVFVAGLGVLAVPAMAGAQPYDPHIPKPLDGWCPGGSHIADLLAYCEGTSYPDGTRWNMYRFGYTAWQPLRCIIPNGTPDPPLAPKGGCGGAWQGGQAA